MAHLVMKIGTWGIAHNAQTWILVSMGIAIFGYMMYDCVTTVRKR